MQTKPFIYLQLPSDNKINNTEVWRCRTYISCYVAFRISQVGTFKNIHPFKESVDTITHGRNIPVEMTFSFQFEERSSEGRRKAVQQALEEEEQERGKSDNNLAIEIARQLQGKVLLSL